MQVLTVIIQIIIFLALTIGPAAMIGMKYGVLEGWITFFVLAALAEISYLVKNLTDEVKKIKKRDEDYLKAISG